MTANRFKEVRSAATTLLATVTFVVALGSAASAQSPATGENMKTEREQVVAAVLKANPQARQVAPDRISVADGVELLLPTTVDDGLTVAAPPACQFLYMCFWEHASSDGFGVGFRLTACGIRYDLGGYRYPDFVWVGTNSPGVPKWNDRISSWNNNQTTGTVARLYNWVGSWSQVATSRAPDFLANARDRGVNDIIDSIIVC